VLAIGGMFECVAQAQCGGGGGGCCGSQPPPRRTWVKFAEAQLQPPSTETDANGTMLTDLHGDGAGEAKGMPVLIYFFWPGDKNDKGEFLDPRGEASKKIDDKVFGETEGDDMEKVARVARDFHTIKVNAKSADPGLMKTYQVNLAAVPCFRVTSAEGKVVAAIGGLKLGANDLKKELEKCLKTQFPEYCRELEAKLKDIAKVYDEGKAAMKKDSKEDLGIAIAKFQEVMDAIPRSSLIDPAAANLDLCKKKLKKMNESAKK
jgi:hypothetical protein